MAAESFAWMAGMNSAGQPTCASNIARRTAVFGHTGRCYRSGISYNAPLKCYLGSQIIPASDTRFEGGFAICDAPEPWGPWTRVFFTEAWDVGPGETANIPSKWISDDGQTIHMVFSGDDSFSVGAGKLRLAP